MQTQLPLFFYNVSGHLIYISAQTPKNIVVTCEGTAVPKEIKMILSRIFFDESFFNGTNGEMDIPKFLHWPLKRSVCTVWLYQQKYAHEK